METQSANKMTATELATLLDGRLRGAEITDEEAAVAKASGLLVAYVLEGDQEIRFRGLIDDRALLLNQVRPVRLVGGKWIAPSFDEAGRALMSAAPGFDVDVRWKPENRIRWGVFATVPCQPFTVRYRNGHTWCVGAVIDVNDMPTDRRISVLWPDDSCSLSDEAAAILTDGVAADGPWLPISSGDYVDVAPSKGDGFYPVVEQVQNVAEETGEMSLSLRPESLLWRGRWHADATYTGVVTVAFADERFDCPAEAFHRAIEIWSKHELADGCDIVVDANNPYPTDWHPPEDSAAIAA